MAEILKYCVCSQTCSHVLTVVQVPHCRVIGEAWIKVCHQRGNILRGGQHPMSDLPHEDEPCVTQVHISKYSEMFSTSVQLKNEIDVKE